jgi:hypothetical protein
VADLIVSVRLKGQDETATARLVDISTTGARFAAPAPIGQVNEEIDISVRLTIGDIEEYVRLPGYIRRQQVEAPEGQPDAFVYYHGVEFRPLPSPVRLALYAYVYSRLAE